MAADDRQWRIDPMTGFLNPEELTETHTIRAFTNFNRTGIQLDEGILYESPSSVSIPGYTEVPKGTTPSIGEFRVDYDPLKEDGTAITTPRHLNTGFIEFSDDAIGDSVTVTYKGTGLIVKPSNIGALLGDQTVTGGSLTIEETLYVEGDLILGGGNTGSGSINMDGDLTVGGTVSFEGSVLNAIPQIAVFTSSGTWTVPAGVTKCYVKVIGAGGGGGGSGGTGQIGGSGGGGGISEKRVTGLTPGSNITITVGAGGTAGTGPSPLANGGDGGSSSFGAYCSATGGTGGKKPTSPDNAAAGLGGIGSSGDLNYSLGDGSSGYRDSTQEVTPGVRGGGPGGAGNVSAAGSAGRPYGGGGASGADSQNGGAGASGVVIIYY